MQPVPTIETRLQDIVACRMTDKFRKWKWAPCVALILLSAGIVWYYFGFVYPRTITSYDQLQPNIGNRVTFATIVDQRNKAYELVYLDNNAIRFSHIPGGIEWSPAPGENCRVVGVINYEPNSMWEIAYQLSHAEYFPVSRVSSENVE